ncbi:hypothetical protein [Aliamphritea spongicola]|uniref:hypothetical protein n=1 Tax=Aliamphritea spongicola TaxID=707589 RepID=UPI00196BA1FE|nr:hypothetical protein [Aliamphritea spongicola]MBN3560850.1 hypothetical protein [Aliamphritea spongicola]
MPQLTFTSFPALLLGSSLLLSSGCFYMVEPGQGGVAERFTQPENYLTPGVHPQTDSWPHTETSLEKQRFMFRLGRCQALKKVHHKQGLTVTYPHFYQHINLLLTRSLRLHVAGFYPQANEAMDTAEYLLKQADKDVFTDMQPVGSDTPAPEHEDLPNRDNGTAVRSIDQEIIL